MAIFVPCKRDQAFLLPPDMKECLPAYDLAHFVIAAAERVSLAAFRSAIAIRASRNTIRA